jgi:CRP-like cAMP-binding protein
MPSLASIQDAAIFDGLTRAELDGLADMGQDQPAAEGDRLFTRGDEADTFFIVRNGRFALTLEVRVLDGHVEMPVEEKVAGDALGWSALVAPYRSVYSGYCMHDGSVICFPRGELEALLSADTHLGYRFSRNLAQLMGNRIRALQDLWMEEVEQSMGRIEYWTHTRLSDDWITAIKSHRKHGRWWRHSSH